MRRRRRRTVGGLAEAVLGRGFFNTADLTEIGRAVDDLFVDLEVAPENLFDLEEYLPSEDADADEIKRDVEDMRQAWREFGDRPVGLVPDIAEPIDLGAKLVDELEARGFKVVREGAGLGDVGGVDDVEALHYRVYEAAREANGLAERASGALRRKLGSVHGHLRAAWLELEAVIHGEHRRTHR